MANLENNVLKMAAEMKAGFKGEDMALGLELALTESAFGHEHALINLENTPSIMHKEELINQIENHKKVYFWARESLRQINPEKLLQIEEELRAQKDALFNTSYTVH
ncbi:hypothetical protein K1X76_09330 [bacterium]|nr:hypothetical protein [bacterium]